MVLHMAWRSDFGGPRVQLELAQALRRLGHEVDKFSAEDAITCGRRISHLPSNSLITFGIAAGQFIRAHGKKYDVIDAQQGNILSTKAKLKYQGKLVVRSAGLVHHYNALENEFHKSGSNRLTPSTVCKSLGWRRRQLIMQSNRWAAERSFDAADAILVHTAAEQSFLNDSTQWASKGQLLPLGLSSEHLSALRDTHRPHRRTNGEKISVLGTWERRKGTDDWRTILETIWKERPCTEFHFIGTRETRVRVLQDLGISEETRIHVTPSYSPKDLPALLQEATIGAFPSYLEGFGLAVVEQLVARVPVVAYRSPGPEDVMSTDLPDLLVRRGNAVELGERILKVLGLSDDEFLRLSDRCRAVGLQYDWLTIAPRIADLYKIS